jgi:multidrug efflux pump subunit AcrA (membrane-fusion protein)
MRSVLLAFSFGALLSASPSGAADIASEAPSTSLSLTARGVIEARHTANIAAPLSERLTSVPYREGTSFGAGAVIAKFDCTAMEAELEALRDAHATLSIKHESQSELHAMGAAGELEVKLAASEMKQAASEARAIEARLKNCELKAPWAGRVVERLRQAHETPSVGEPIYSLVRSGSSELIVIVPSAWSSWLKTGQSFAFTVDETGEEATAKVIRLGATVDPVSQTYEIAARFTGSTKARPGMSGTARFERNPN